MLWNMEDSTFMSFLKNVLYKKNNISVLYIFLFLCKCFLKVLLDIIYRSTDGIAVTRWQLTVSY